MKPPSDQLLARLGQILQRTGLILHHWDGVTPALSLGAFTWIPGQGLLVAELGTLDQSGVHLIEAGGLINGEDAPEAESEEIDLITEGGDLVASIYPGRRPDRAPPPPTEAWSRFWAGEIERVKGGE